MSASDHFSVFCHVKWQEDLIYLLTTNIKGVTMMHTKKDSLFPPITTGIRGGL